MNLNINFPIRQYPAIFTAFLGFLIVTNIFVSAQSGRRSTDKTNKPVPSVTPTPETIPKAEKPSPNPEIKLKVVGDVPLAVDVRFGRPDSLQKWVLERLRNSTLLEVEGGASVTLDKAEKLAKNLTDVYVVYVQLEENPSAVSQSTQTKARNGEFWVNFYVLTPGSGNIKLRGKVYLAPQLGNAAGRVLNRRACGSTIFDDELMLWEAGVEVAERVLRDFNIPVPDLKCPGQNNFLSENRLKF